MLRQASITNEYFLGDMPGTLQYNKDPKEILSCLIPDDEDEYRGFTMCEHSAENVRRITPYTQRNTEWKVLLMMKKEVVAGEIWLKAALLNKNTGKVALLTSTNDKANLDRRENRGVKTLDGTWYVGHYRMLAPIAFWRELQNRLLY